MMRLIKAENCDDKLKVIGFDGKETSLIELAKKITTVKEYHPDNKILCQLSQSLVPGGTTNPKFFYQLLPSTIYCLEFIAGTKTVLLKELQYVLNASSIKKTKEEGNIYVYNLISDPHRVWKETPLTYDENEDKGEELPNQILTLLRICNIKKEDYIKNPNILGTKFKYNNTLPSTSSSS